MFSHDRKARVLSSSTLIDITVVILSKGQPQVAQINLSMEAVDSCPITAPDRLLIRTLKCCTSLKLFSLCNLPSSSYVTSYPFTQSSN